MRKIFLAGCCFIGLVQSAQANDLFTVTGVISNGTQTQNIYDGFSSVQDLTNFLHNNNLAALASSYTPISGVNASVNYLGVPVTLSYAANSTTLTFKVPGLGLTQSFTGATRDESDSQFLNYLKGQGQSLVGEFQKYLSGNSPVSPVAGNPGSLQAGLVSSQFNGGAFNTGANATATSSSGGRFGIGVEAGEFSVQGFSGHAYEVPLSYAYRFDDPRWQLQFNLPLGYEELGGARSYSAQFGVGLQMPVLAETDWYLIPTVSAGATGSTDFGTAGVLYSGALNSRYTWHASDDLAVTLGNMIGEVESVGVTIGGYNIDPGVKNTIAKNGLSAEYDTGWHWWDEKISLRAGVAYTNSWGTKLDIPNYTEVFVDFGTITGSDAPFYKRLRFGGTFTFGEGYRAGAVNFGYTF